MAVQRISWQRAQQRMRQLPMGLKVWLGAGLLVGLIAGAVLVALMLIIGLRQHEQRLNARSVPFATALAAAALDAKGVANDERGFLMTGDRRFIAEADRRIDSARTALTLAQVAASADAQRRALGAARAGFERWIEAIRREFAAYRAGDRRGAVAASLGPDRTLRKGYETALTTAQNLGASEIRAGDASVTAASSRSIMILLGFLIVALVAGVSIAY
jgi:methyl-accepting chemotaxis protein